MRNKKFLQLKMFYSSDDENFSLLNDLLNYFYGLRDEGIIDFIIYDEDIEEFNCDE